MKKVNLSTEDVGRKRKVKEHPRIHGDHKLLPRFRERRYKEVVPTKLQAGKVPPGVEPTLIIGEALFHFDCIAGTGEPIYKHVGSNGQVRHRILVGS